VAALLALVSCSVQTTQPSPPKYIASTIDCSNIHAANKIVTIDGRTFLVYDETLAKKEKCR
jgi:hypothetical protein